LSFNVISPSIWSPPPHGFIKLKFYGASKGNPRKAGFGGVFRNNEEGIIRAFIGKLGINRNNIMEIVVLEEGLIITNKNGFNKIIFEGYSLLIINMIKRIQQGPSISKISHSWHLKSSLERLVSLMQNIPIIIPSHVKWVDKWDNKWDEPWDPNKTNRLMENCLAITIVGINICTINSHIKLSTGAHKLRGAGTGNA
jgi:ribonuclease HI